MISDSLIKQIISFLEPYNLKFIGIFGSYARSENTDKSDLDILISFKSKMSLLTLVGIEQELSDLLGIKVDLVTKESLTNSHLKQSILEDLIIIFNEEKRPSIS